MSETEVTRDSLTCEQRLDLIDNLLGLQPSKLRRDFDSWDHWTWLAFRLAGEHKGPTEEDIARARDAHPQLFDQWIVPLLPEGMPDVR